MRAVRIACCLVGAAGLLLLVAGCVTTPARLRSDVLDFVYPEVSDGMPAREVTLELPVRVGIAFAPLAATGVPHARAAAYLSEDQRQELLGRIAAAFAGHTAIERIEVIPSSYLRERGGFENMDRLQAAFGIDLLALVGVDQIQFSETGASSWTYWTLIGAYVIKGERNEVHTVLETAVFDIPSRALLFRAAGEDTGTRRSTPVGTERTRRLLSGESFSEATDDLIEQLRGALAAFEEQAATGTVRGVGTPGIRIVDASGSPVTPGGGALALPEIVLAGLLLGAAGLGRRRRRDRPEAAP